MKRILCIFIAVIITLSGVLFFVGAAQETDYIKYAEFNVCYEALEKAYNEDIKSYNEDVHINWIEVLAYLGAKYGGEFNGYKAAHMDSVIEQLKDGKAIEDITKDMQYYPYYYQVYSAVLGGMLGKYKEQRYNDSKELVYEDAYGLVCYSPIAQTFPYSHYDDFGASRSYGYKRQHLGHDLMAATGTPVIAAEGGTVEIMGWNQYGGWRIGIRSNDKKRYYYYAHLRQNRPFHPDIKEGSQVKPGDVIGYVGRTGYSSTENTNNIDSSHLHFGMELIFDESQKECDNEIWINMYAITKLLEKHKSSVYRIAATKEFYREFDIVME